tara:strand:- start:229 stop:597 length:369 start_codon:yes stop_codon:yes gene_type:complete
MNIHTPIKVYFSNHRGMQSNPVVKQYDIELIKASTPKYKLPHGLCVSGNEYVITFRFNYVPATHTTWNHYCEMQYNKESGLIYYSGQCANYNMHRSFMHTFDIVLPIAEQVFSTGTFTKLAA